MGKSRAVAFKILTVYCFSKIHSNILNMIVMYLCHFSYCSNPKSSTWNQDGSASVLLCTSHYLPLFQIPNSLLSGHPGWYITYHQNTSGTLCFWSCGKWLEAEQGAWYSLLAFREVGLAERSGQVGHLKRSGLGEGCLRAGRQKGLADWGTILCVLL